MIREEWEDILYAAVPDEVIQDQLNDYVLSLEYENYKLRELVKVMWLYDYAGKFSTKREDIEHVAMVYRRMIDLGVEVS